MDALVKALGPVFVAGLAIQQLLELLDSIVGKSLGDKKPMVFSIVSLVVGLALSFGIGLRVLHPLGLINVSFALDAVVTGVIISAGTEGINSIMKFLGYTKDNKKKKLEQKSASFQVKEKSS